MRMLCLQDLRAHFSHLLSMHGSAEAMIRISAALKDPMKFLGQWSKGYC